MKKKLDLARAWRDQDYYLSLTDEERASLDDHPAGAIADPVLRSVTGGCGHDPGQNPDYTLSQVTCFPTSNCTACPPSNECV